VIRAATGAGPSNPLDTQIGTLDLANSNSGAVQINEADGLTLNLVRQESRTGAVSVVAQGPITVPAGRPGVTAQDGSVTLDARGPTAQVDVNGSVATTGGTVDIRSQRDVFFGPGGEVLSTTGTVLVRADSDNTGGGTAGALTMADGAVIDAGSGDVDISAGGDVTLASVVTTGEARITSRYSSIRDGGDTEPELNVARAVLRAATGVGDSSDPFGALETRTNGGSMTLAGVTQSGDFQIHNSGALVVGTVDGVNGVLIQDPATGDGNDAIVITTASPQTINAPVLNAAGGDIILAALGNLDSDGLTINADITATTHDGIDGNIYLNAGDDIIYNLGLISAANAGTVNLNAGEDYNQLPWGNLPQAGNASGDVVMASGRVVQSDTGTIQVEASRDIWLSILTTSTHVIVSADRHKHDASDGLGEIIDNLSGEEAHLRANSAYLEAGSGMGLGVDPGTGLLGDIDTQLATIQIVNHGPVGDIHVSETPAGGNLGVTWLTQSNPAGVGDTWVRTEDGTLTVVGGSAGVQIVGSGNVTLSGSGGDGRNLVVNATVRATSGTINLHADEDVRAEDARGRLITSSGDIVFRPNFDATAHLGMTDDGTIFFADGSRIESGTGNIQFYLQDYDGRIDGDIRSTTGRVVKWDVGILNLNGDQNNYTGPTEVRAGCLLVNGAIASDGPNPPAALNVTVFSGALLGGVGTIGGTASGRDVLVRAGGILNPGRIDTDGTRRTGRLTVNGDVTLQAGAVFRVQIQGLEAATQYDQLRVNGLADLTGLLTGASGAVLDTLLSYAAAWGSWWRIIDNDRDDTIETRFQGLADGASFTVGGVLLEIAYRAGDQNDVVLTAPGKFDFDGPLTATDYVGIPLSLRYGSGRGRP
jgi:autotransporter-associated beta strand protein